MKIGRILAAAALVLAAADIARPACCTDSSNATLAPYDNCTNYSEMTCGSAGARCGWKRANWCKDPAGCGDTCVTLTELILVDLSSSCYCEDEEAGCVCEEAYVYTFAYKVGCNFF